MPETPLAYLLTWTTRGTRLHGDARGSVDREHNRPGSALAPESAGRLAYHKEIVGCGLFLDGRARVLVEEAIRNHAGVRRWTLLAGSARSNHVHAVVSAPGYRPEEVMRQLKSWATRRLRESEHAGAAPVWTRHGSTRYLWDQRSVDAAVRYVVTEQDRGARYDGR